MFENWSHQIKMYKNMSFEIDNDKDYNSIHGVNNYVKKKICVFNEVIN